MFFFCHLLKTFAESSRNLTLVLPISSLEAVDNDIDVAVAADVYVVAAVADVADVDVVAVAVKAVAADAARKFTITFFQ